MIDELFPGLPYNNLIFALFIVAISVVFARVFMIFFERVVLHITAKTKTSLDEAIVGAIRRPIYVAIILFGIYLAVDSLNFADAYLDPVSKGFMVAWVLLGVYASTKVLRAVLAWYSTGVASKTTSKMDDTMIPIIRKLINVFIYVIGLMVILKGFGVEITPLVAGLGVGGIAIALALQDSLSNLFSGAFIISDKVIKVGDFIEMDSINGYVEEIGWRSTRIRTLPNNFVIVPNSRLANAVITDYSAPVEEMALVIPVGVGYGSDLEKVEHATTEVARHIQKTAAGAVRGFEPFIRYSEFGDSNINFSVILRVEKFVDQYLVKHEFIKALKKRYDHENIEISFPVRKIVK